MINRKKRSRDRFYYLQVIFFAGGKLLLFTNLLSKLCTERI